MCCLFPQKFVTAVLSCWLGVEVCKTFDICRRPVGSESGNQTPRTKSKTTYHLLSRASLKAAANRVWKSQCACDQWDKSEGISDSCLSLVVSMMRLAIAWYTKSATVISKLRRRPRSLSAMMAFKHVQLIVDQGWQPKPCPSSYPNCGAAPGHLRGAHS